MKLILSLVISFILCLNIYGQTNYAVSEIPKNLLTRAGAIIRNSETIIEVKALDEVHYRKKFAVTIFNPSAIDQSYLYLGYDKITSIKSVKGAIYNEFGMLQGRITERNFQDRSAVSDFSLYEDNRVKFFAPSQINYPFTIEYEYETKTKQSLYFPTWVPCSSTGIAIEKSSLDFICPADFNLRHKELNYKEAINETSLAGKKTYRWEVSNINAIRVEPYSPNYEDYLVTVKLAPETFAFKSMKARFTNWKEFGSWTNNYLLKGRDEIPQSTKDYIISLVQNIPDPKEKAKKIYEFMQLKTRYVSVQIGIGGYQPYPAADVDRLGYGDCKGLVNYMHSLLKVAGIESYYSVVYAGSSKRDITPDFTSMDGNHVILCLPFKSDTTWLECTDKYAPFGFLDDFTDDRYVVACTPEGGKIMRTPKYTALDSKQIREATFKIAADGALNGTITTSFQGTQYDNHHMLLNEAYTEQIKKLPELYLLPNLEVQSLEFKQHKEAKPETRETFTLKSYNYCSIADGKLRLAVNKINQTTPLKEVHNRTNPVCITRGYYDEDTYSYEIPEGYRFDLPPYSKVIQNVFGKYTADVVLNGKTIVYKRTMLLNDGRYNAGQYQELVDFFQIIADTDNLQLTLSKTN